MKKLRLLRRTFLIMAAVAAFLCQGIYAKGVDTNYTQVNGKVASGARKKYTRIRGKG